MAFVYLDLETANLGESKSTPQKVIVAAHRVLNQGPTPLRMHTEWGLGSELAVLEALEKETRIYSKKWDSVIVGWNLGTFDIPLLRRKGVQYGFIDFAKDWEKPCIDLQHLGYLWNWFSPVPDDIEYSTGIPGCFYGAKLSKFSMKVGQGTNVPEMYRQGRFQDIENYSAQEAWAFDDLFNVVAKEAPGWFQNTIAPQLGLDMKGRGGRLTKVAASAPSTAPLG